MHSRHALALLLGVVLCGLLSSTHATNINTVGMKNWDETEQAYIPSQYCSGHTNGLPINNALPQLINSTTNGKLFIVPGEQSDGPPIKIAHLYGSAYEMGFAAGTLLKEDLNQMFPALLTYMEEQVDPYIEKYLPDLPEPLAKLIEEFGIVEALKLTAVLTKDFTPQHFFDEIQGMADASGVSADTILEYNLLPELIKAGCTIVEAWGDATAADGEGSLFQLRALDFNSNGPFQNWPLVTVYHPDEGHGHAFAMPTWSGMIGSIAGFSSSGMAVSEKVWLHYNGSSSREGYPWMFLLRDVLQFDNDIDAAITRMADADRTCSVYFGLGDYSGEGVIIEYSHDTVNVYNDHDTPPWYVPNAANVSATLPGLVYADKHSQPSTDPCLPMLLSENYGNLNATTFMRDIAAPFKTGDLLVAVYDYANMDMYLSNASPVVVVANGTLTWTNAYDRMYTYFNVTALFEEPSPL
eukprot:TRINITY_DN7276_c0_g1_i1.p1 TRINITY_DN7276_c0_g1~~TRINITY_DN7276_c0_g1_i1.p1  ORF type:complete len:467 (+),score=129.97 TRINITY_DN7276_c0_g1_i1:146-1546(+)